MNTQGHRTTPLPPARLDWLAGIRDGIPAAPASGLPFRIRSLLHGTALLGLGWILAACGQTAPEAAPPDASSPRPRASASAAKTRHLDRLSAAGRRIFELCREGKREAAERLLEDFDDPTEGRSETEVLKGAVALLDIAGAPGGIRGQLQGLLAHRLPGVGSPEGRITQHLGLATDLDPAWKRIQGSILLDLTSSLLRRKSGQGESVHSLGDLRFVSLRPAYRTDGKSRGRFEMNGLLFASDDGVPVETDAMEVNAAMARQIAASLRTPSKTAPVPVEAWRAILRVAEDLQPGAILDWRGDLEDIENAFAAKGLFTSALLVHEAVGAARNRGHDTPRDGLAALQRYERQVDAPGMAQRLCVAIGHWVDRNPEAAREPSNATGAELGALLQALARKGAWYNAVVLAEYAGLSDLDIQPPAPSEGGVDGESARRLAREARESRDPQRTRTLWTEAAALGQAEALYELGRLAESGGRKEQAVLERARGFYMQAANRGVPSAMFQLGCFIESARLPAAPVTNLYVRLYRAAAEAGSPDAIGALGVCHLNGEGMPKSETKGFEWIARAARLGNAAAQYHLGLLHAKGTGTTADPVLAFHAMSSAATNGWPAAMYLLSQAFRNGVGTDPNTAKADEWLILAAKAGDPGARQEAESKGLMTFRALRQNARGEWVVEKSKSQQTRDIGGNHPLSRADMFTQELIAQQRRAQDQERLMENQRRFEEEQAYHQRKMRAVMDQKQNQLNPGTQRIYLR